MSKTKEEITEYKKRWALANKDRIRGKNNQSLATNERLNHYSNFQPLWVKDNILKSNKI